MKKIKKETKIEENGKNINKEVGLKLKKLRIKNELTQDELANLMNVSRGLVVKWEKKGIIKPEYYDKLAEIFEVDKSTFDYKDKESLKEKKKEYFKVIFKFVLITLCLLYLLFSVMTNIYFINNYNKEKFSEIRTVQESKYLYINYSYLFKTNEQIILYITPTYLVDKDEIKKINIYYFDGIEDVLLMGGSPLDLYYGQFNISESGKLFKEYDRFIESAKVEITLKNGTKERLTLSFTELYTNDNFFTKKPIIKKAASEENEHIEKSELSPKVEKLHKKIEELLHSRDYALEFKYKDKNISIFDMDEIVSFKINEKDNYYELTYTNFDNFEKFDVEEGELFNTEKLYNYNFNDKKCTDDNNKIVKCDTLEKDLKLFNEILNYVLKLDKIQS